VHAFPRGERSGRRHLAQLGRDSPGPVDAPGRAGLKRDPMAKFGTAPRWLPTDLTGEDRRVHAAYIDQARRRAETGGKEGQGGGVVG
jgi:hypothetical protein